MKKILHLILLLLPCLLMAQNSRDRLKLFVKALIEELLFLFDFNTARPRLQTQHVAMIRSLTCFSMKKSIDMMKY